MSAKGNPAVIGTFVLGALALLVVGVLSFGGTRWFQDKRQYVTYFDGSVKGLRVGSNVLFRGVRVGYVTDIRVTSDSDMTHFTVPVTFQILPDAFTVVRDGGEQLSMSDLGRPQTRKALIERGLRSKLESESFVTGQLVIQLDFYPDQPAVFRSDESQPFPEIPSAPSDIQQIMERVQRFVAEFQSRVDADELAAGVQGIVAGLDKLINSPELKGAIGGIDRLLSGDDTRELPGQVRSTFRSAQLAFEDARDVLKTVDGEVGPTLADARSSLRALNDALESAVLVMDSARGQIDQDSTIGYELARTLEETRALARSLRTLSDHLERHPESLIRGRQERK